LKIKIEYAYDQIIEEVYNNSRSCLIYYQREQEKIKEHVEKIQPEVLSEGGLFISPRTHDFK